jgi:hypothetical protein
MKVNQLATINHRAFSISVKKKMQQVKWGLSIFFKNLNDFS